MKYKVGDKVRITDKLYGHRFDIGAIVVIITRNSYNYHGTLVNDRKENWWAFQDDECVIINRKLPNNIKVI